jgi:hypothetical protein
MKKEEITNLINAAIKDNDSGLITAEVMRNVLNAINDYEPIVADELGDGEDAISQKAATEAIRKLSAALNSLEYTYISTATPSTKPATLTGDEKVFYIATEEGLYSNFGVGNISELSIIKSENGSWMTESFSDFSKLDRFISVGAAEIVGNSKKVAAERAESRKSSDIRKKWHPCELKLSPGFHAGHSRTYA